MAADDSQSVGQATDEPKKKSGRQPLSQAQRKRFEALFTHAGKQSGDYAIELYSQCVLGDKDNTLYWQHFLGSLRQKYHDNKRGAKLASLRAKTHWGTIKKCQLRKDWDGVFKHGIEVLLVNPWDVSTLMALAAAGEELDLDEVPLIFYRMAMEVDPKDVDVNRAAAKALRVRRQHDQAIACWRRVLEVKKEDEEAQRQVGELMAERVIHKGGYEDADSSRDVANKDEAATADQPKSPRQELTPEQKLEMAIRENPSDVAPYLELAEMLCQKNNFAAATQLLAKACEVSGQDAEVRGRLLDAEIRGLRKALRLLEEEHKKTGADEVKQKWQAVRTQFDVKSLERSKLLAERFPNELSYQFDLGASYHRVGQFKEAIEFYQKSRNDPRRKGECLLRLGQCFGEINQPRLAETNYDAALEEITGQYPELLKEALYCAGKASLETNKLEKAEQQLTELAGLDFGYRDVSALLDKVNELRDTE